MDKFELVKFTDNNFEINVRADIDNDTVWLTQKEMDKKIQRQILYDIQLLQQRA